MHMKTQSFFFARGDVNKYNKLRRRNCFDISSADINDANVCVSLFRTEQFTSCRECSGIKQNCPHQSNNHSCSVPNALDLVRPEGTMFFKVNATSEIGSATSKVNHTNLYNISKIFRL